MDVSSLSPIFLQLGPVTIYWYGVMYAVGISCSIPLALWLQKSSYWGDTQNPFPSQESLINYATTLCLVGLIGGRLGNFLFYDWNILITNPLEVFAFWNGGMSIHGAFAFSGVYILIKTRGDLTRFLRIADYTAACIPIALTFGRIGNFINGELYGYPTTLPWGMRFAHGGPFLRHPSQLYEAFLEGIVLQAWMLWCIIFWKGFQRKGFLTLNFIGGYFVARGFVDLFFRQPLSNELIWGMKKSYLLSLMLLIWIIGAILLERWLNERAPHLPKPHA